MKRKDLNTYRKEIQMIEFMPTPAQIGWFMRVYWRLCPTVNDEATIEDFAHEVGWCVETTHDVAFWLDEQGRIETDRGLGTGITMIEGRQGT